MRLCDIPGCGGTHNAQGYCRSHYNEFCRPKCTVDGCMNQRKYRTGLCAKHTRAQVNRPGGPCPHVCGREWHPLDAPPFPLFDLAACPGSAVPSREEIPA